MKTNLSASSHPGWILASFAMLLVALPVHGQEVDGESRAPELDDSVETMRIIGTRVDSLTVAGSAFVLEEEVLERYEYDDIHRVVNLVPGVYFREEDGFGLRPNIGIRGASSERSAKITLMEDGVLIAPAPYSAPAAYYFPLTTRMVGAEVFKGPASIQYGPNTIGGAINLVSRPIPRRTEGMIDASYGSFNTYKLHGTAGGREDWGGLGIEALRLQSDGFKDIDNVGADSGFARNEFVAKGLLLGPTDWSLDLETKLKLSYSNEQSNETYLGLSDEDFRDDPHRRYAGSQQGDMEWDWYGVELRQRVGISEQLDLDFTVYRHGFERAWRKLNRFRGGPSLSEILANPDAGQSAVFFSVLTGESDSSTEDETLLVGTNDREFVSQGVQAVAQGWLDTPVFGLDIAHSIEGGVRLHNDEIDRFHTEDGFVMRDGIMRREGTATEVVRDETGEALAWALYLRDEMEIGDLLLTPGVRVEIIDTDFDDRLNGSRQSDSETVVLPGLGAYYQATSWLGLLAGIHRGFSPVSPGQPDEVDAEDSINYEAGARVSHRFGRVPLDAEFIGFFNDYDNLIGQCTFSAGCEEDQVDRQFNGGEVNIYGLEMLAATEIPSSFGVRFPFRLVYTFTQTEFQSSFISDNPLFGEVEEGDELPYVPEHQLAASLGIAGDIWGVEGTFSYRARMRDVPGQGDIEGAEATDDAKIVDLRAYYRPRIDPVGVFESLELYAGADNLFDEEYIASRRPFGARPGKPLSVFGGVKIGFGS